MVQSSLLIMKCLTRLNVEIGVKDGMEPHHPVFWVVLLVCAVYANGIGWCLEKVCLKCSSIGCERRRRKRSNNNDNDNNESDIVSRRERGGLAMHMQLELEEPLLSDDDLENSIVEHVNANVDAPTGTDTDTGTEGNGNEDDTNSESAKAASDITGDSHYKAGWKDLLSNFSIEVGVGMSMIT